MNSPKNKTVKFLTLGCKVNQYETQEMRERLSEAGYVEVSADRSADLYVINTCTVTGKADRESMNLIHRCRGENEGGRVVVTGCMVSASGKVLGREKREELFSRIKHAGADIILENGKKRRITDWIPGITGIKSRKSGISGFKGHARAFLKIQEGCDNFCSYCIVPFVRGRSRSKPLRKVISEARALSAAGYSEIVLTGICIGDYGREFKPASSLAVVLDSLSEIGSVARIRISSIEAKDVTDKLIDAMAKNEKVCRHLHIPIQSGDDSILRSMRRKYKREDYLKLIKKLRRRIPGISITTDVLIGYPGESEKNFANTLDLIARIKPLRTHIFTYSGRPGTIACEECRAADPVTDAVLKERRTRLFDLAAKCAEEAARGFTGRRMKVLIEKIKEGSGSFAEGYTDNYLKVRFRPERALKRMDIADVILKEAGKEFITAQPV